MLECVISGGQTGVDQAALEAARFCGLKTGGWIPKGFKTLKGNNPKLGTLYGLKETNDSTYGYRTGLNVRDGDGTLRIAEKFGSAGERCTLKHINNYGKPSFDIKVSFDRATYSLVIPDSYILEVRDFIRESNIRTLNVAGNSEETSPGIQECAREFLIKVFNG